DDAEACAAQALRLAQSGTGETICVHGDGARAVETARAGRSGLERAGLLRRRKAGARADRVSTSVLRSAMPPDGPVGPTRVRGAPRWRGRSPGACRIRTSWWVPAVWPSWA